MAQASNEAASGFGIRAFASAAGINFAAALAGRGASSPPSEPSHPRGEASDASLVSSGSSSSDTGKVKKKKRRHEKKGKRGKVKRPKSRSPHEEEEDNGIFIVDTAPERDNLSYGTMLDPPVYRHRDATFSLRHMLGASALSSGELQWITSSAPPVRFTAEYQIAGVDPTVASKASQWAGYRGRYFVPGAVPARPLMNLSKSVKRLQRQRQAVAATQAAQEKESEWAAAQRRNEDMVRALQANLGTKVVSFGAPAGTVSAPGARDPDAGIGYLPLDPPGVFVVDAEEEEQSGEGQERARREQLAIQAEGALTPAFGESLPQFVQRRTRELNEATRERPKDEAAWLDLAAFQSVALDAGVKLKRRDLAVIDKQVAVYERGLEQCPHSIRLFRAMLRAAQEIRTREEMEALWKKCLQSQSGESVLWLDFIGYVASLYSSFTLPSLRTVARNALATIHSVQRSEAADDRAKGVYVFEAGLQSAHFQRRAAMLAVFAACGTLEACGGNSEQCIARWQALLEFNTNTPDTIAKKPLDTRLKFFEAFWESDAPRVGDVEGGGWSVWLAQKMSGQEAADHVTSSWEAVPDVFLALPTEPQVWGVLGTDETAVAPEDTPAVVGAPGSVSVAAASDSAPVVDTDTRVEMVYSALHGYRIPMRVEVEGEEGTTTSGYYKRILGELREENGSDAAALAKAQKAAAKILKPSPLSPDDPLVMWLYEEDARAREQHLPLRANPAAPVSPLRCVTFDSLRGLLFDVGADLQAVLITHALEALGVHILHTRSSNSMEVHAAVAKLENPIQAGFGRDTSPPSLTPFLSQPSVPPHAASPYISTLAVEARVCASPATLMFVRNMLHTLQGLPVCQHLPLLTAALIEFEGVWGSVTGAGSTGREYAKALLAQPAHSAQLPLWLSYACMETSLGNVSEGKRVLEKAVGLASSLPADAARFRYHLWYALVCMVSPGGTEPPSPEAVYMLTSCVDAAAFTPYARALKKADVGSLTSPTRVIKARASFAQTLQAETKAARDSLLALLSSWLRACASSGSPPGLTFTVAVKSDSAQLHHLGDFAARGDSKLSPLASFLACSALLDLHTQGLPAACASFSTGVRLFQGWAVALARANSGAQRREAPEDTLAAVTAALDAWTGDGAKPWRHSFVSVGKQKSSSLLQPDAALDPDFALLFPVDTSHSVGAAIDYCLYNCEWLYTVWVRVMRVEDAHTRVSPRVSRHLLEEALSTFPSNPSLLSLYTSPERNVIQSSLRARQFLDKFITSPDCPCVVWAQLLFSELRRAGAGPDVASESALELVSVQSLRRLFEQAVTSSGGAGSVLLWRMYARFELVSGNAAGARRVLFRAMNRCPWSKALWTDSIRRFRPYLSSDEIVELLRVMASKGLRVRAALTVGTTA